jgi:hypothetical protein
LDFTAFNKFEQNVCKALKVRESQKVALGIGRFSTGFSTDCVENLESQFLVMVRPITIGQRGKM